MESVFMYNPGLTKLLNLAHACAEFWLVNLLHILD